MRFSTRHLFLGLILSWSASPAELFSKSEVAVKNRGPHDQRLEYITTYRDESGAERTNEHSYVVLGTGMNRWDAGLQQYVPASEEIELINGKGVARKAQYQAIFSANANDIAGVVDLEMPDGKRIIMQTIGLALADANGNSVFLGEVKDSDGVLIGNNTVLYQDAFDGIQASIRIRTHLYGIESDVIINEKIDRNLIANLGIDPATAHVEAWHQVLQRPGATKRVSFIQRKSGQRDEDHTVEFGAMTFSPGHAFSIGENEAADGRANRDYIPVAKEWVSIDGFDFLIERIPFEEAEAQLGALPERPQARVIPKQKIEAAFAQRVKGKRSKPVSLAALEVPRAKTEGKNIAAMTRVDKGTEAGFVLDYVLNTDQSNYTLKGDTTYYITNAVILSGTTVIEGGTVVKFSPYTSLSPVLKISGGLDCQTKPYHPAIFTSHADNSVGETIPNAATNSSGHYAWYNLFFTISSSNVVLHDIQTRYSHNGIGFADRTGTNKLWNIQIYHCYKGIELSRSYLNIRNALIEDSQYAALFYQNTSNRRIDAEHLTINRADKYFYLYPGSTNDWLYLTNSIVTGATNGASDTVSASFSSISTSPASGVFQTVGLGAHYLAAGSPHRNAGTTNISSEAKAILLKTTTYPPLTLISDVTTDTTLLPIAQRDTDLPDRGYHYTALDYLIGELNLTNSSLILTNGVAIGLTGTSPLKLRHGGKFISTGSVLTPNKIVWANTLQEQNAIGGSVANRSVWSLSSNPAMLPEVQLRFTEIWLPANNGNLLSHNGWIVSGIAATDCYFAGAKASVSLYPDGETRVMIFGFTNNVFFRPNFDLSQDSDTLRMKVLFYNNLVLGGSFQARDYNSSGTWVVKDSAFNSVALSGENLINSHNAYSSGMSPLPNSLGGNITIYSFDFQAGPFGKHYYPASGTNLNNLRNAGSRLASDAGLFHHTTGLDQEKEANSQVDIGFHYAALAKVRFAGSDTSTQGNWKGIYGQDGYNIIGDSSSYPAYASATPSGKSDLTWSTSTSETRALQRVSTGRIAACWYSPTSFDIVLTQTGGPHLLALYCLDWDSVARNQTIEIREPGGGNNVYDFKQASKFNEGVYLKWEIVGSATVRITRVAGANSLVAGLFFGPATGTPSDTDGDGIPDYLEDRNGNGAFDASINETKWDSSNNGVSGPAGVLVYTNLKQ